MQRISEISVTYNPRKKRAELPHIKKSEDVAACFREVWSNKMEYVEEMYLMLLNRSNKVLGFTKVSMGGVNATIVDPKIIFQVALKSHASGIILAHNHPSGGLKPSEQDIRLTKKIKEGAVILDISLLDHLILSKESYYSFADEGLV
ncbi:MAG: JAB domain-containing protein [Bacteroidota bacterium]|nr:JAB domain-containing protein [Bacteroidota bacterium]